MEWMDFLKRGGPKNNPPATNGPHLDYYQDWPQRQLFAGFEGDAASLDAAPDIVLGVWRPCMMANPVHDYPMALVSAATLKESAQVRFEQKFTHRTPNGKETVENLAAHLKFEEGQVRRGGEGTTTPCAYCR